MKVFWSFVLGAPAGLIAASGASAGDLPSKAKSPAVDYVRICDAFGKRFFYIPGTDTCLKISGFVRADYGIRNVTNQFGVTGGNVPAPTDGGGFAVHGDGDVTSNSAAARNSSGFGVRTKIEFDARSKTEWGALRGFLSYQFETRNGLLGDNNFRLDKTYIQFAGITAGRVQSFFDFYADSYPLDISRGSDESTIALAYTASFGSGFSATIALEDPVKRRSANIGSSEVNGGVFTQEFRSALYGGSKIPDVVGVLAVDQSEDGWGKAQLSGAYHQINTVNNTAVGAAKASGAGWAVQAGVVINLPSLAKGDEFYVQGAYAVGAKDYLGIDESLGDRSNGLARLDVDAVAVATVPTALQGVNGGAYKLEKGRGFNIQAGMQHYWTPEFRQYVWAAYTTWNYGAAARASDWLDGGFNNGKEVFAGTGFVWSPVKNLELTTDLSYTRLIQQINTSENALPPGANKNGSSFTGRLRLLRKF